MAGTPHKRRRSIDIEDVTVSQPPIKQNHQTNNLQLHAPTHNPQNHQQYCFSNTILLYIILIVLLTIWIILQLSMAHIYMNSSQPITDLHLVHENNMTMVHQKQIPSSSFGEYISVLVNQIKGYIYLVSSTILPSSNLEDVTTYTNTPHERIEEDYVFIFYILLGINLLTMIPSWCKYLSSTKEKKNHTIMTNGTQQNDQVTKDDADNAHAQIHSKLLQTYLPAYLFATMADWLQGPYKYALYSSYGYTQRDIAHLFVAGYGSGMVLGSFVGGMADSYGRKRLCIGYCLAYTFSVLMKHCKHFYVLLLGRVGGGIATSLLFSVFEAWLIGAHGERGLGHKSGLKKEEEEKWLAKSLSLSMYGSSLVAIGSGVLANIVVANSGKMRPLYDPDSSIYYGGYIAAFDVCLVPLVLCATLIIFLWEENYGEAAATESKLKEVSSNNDHGIDVQMRENSQGYLKKHSSIMLEDAASNNDVTNEECNTLLEDGGTVQRKEGAFSTLYSGCRTVWDSPNILICCIIGSVFEGAMYIFIFLWTPSLTSLQEKLDNSHGRIVSVGSTEKDPHTDSELPFGWIFSSFMVCCMLGSIAFSRLSNAGVSASKCLVGILALASLSCLAMSTPYFYGISKATSSANTPQYIGMLLYEFCIGFYYPAMGTVKGTIVPEDQRAAIYNVFRLPLNLLVLIYLVGDFSTEVSFLANALLLMGMSILQLRLLKSSGVAHSRQGHQHSK